MPEHGSDYRNTDVQNMSNLLTLIITELYMDCNINHVMNVDQLAKHIQIWPQLVITVVI
jgi:hypothetical protein